MTMSAQLLLLGSSRVGGQGRAGAAHSQVSSRETGEATCAQHVRSDNCFVGM
jgi:hypothetical protein